MLLKKQKGGYDSHVLDDFKQNYDSDDHHIIDYNYVIMIMIWTMVRNMLIMIKMMSSMILITMITTAMEIIMLMITMILKNIILTTSIMYINDGND